MDNKGMSVHLLLDYTRIMSIIEEYSKNLKFLDSLKTKLTSDINMIQGEEMKRLLGEQKELEKRYAELLQQADQLKGLAEKSKLQEVKKDIDELEKKIKENTKNMWKILKDNPDVNENRDKIERNKKELAAIFEKAYNGLQNDSMDEYKEYVDLEKSKLEKLDKLKLEEKELIKIIKETTAEFNHQQSESAAEEDRIKKEIKDLKQQLSKEQLEKQLKIGYAIKQKDGEISCRKRMLDYKESQIQKEIDELRKQEENERTVNEKVLRFLKERTNEYRQKCEAWDRKNEQELNKLDTEIKSIKAQREDVNEKLKEVKVNLKKDQDLEKERLTKDDSVKKEVTGKESKDKARERAIKWIQDKLTALHPFKPPRRRAKGTMMAKMAMMK